MTREANFETCHEVAYWLELIAEGELYKCPRCDGFFEAEDAHFCDYCKIELPRGRFKRMTFHAFIEEAPEYEVTYGRNGTFKGGRVVVNAGSPWVFIDTREEQVEMRVPGGRITAPIKPAICQAIDEALFELSKH